MRAGDALALIAVLLLACVFGIPLFWIVAGSLKQPNQVLVNPPVWIPLPPQWQNFIEVQTVVPVYLFMRNSFVVAVSATLGSLITTSIVAYGFANFEFRGRRILFFIVIATMFLPQEVTLIPTYLLFARLGWVDSYLPLVVPSYLAKDAFAVFLFRQSFLALPRDFFDAARIDGCGYLRYFWQILIPLSVPTVISLAILLFQGNWTDFLNPLIYLSTPEKMTMPVGLLQLQSALQTAYSGASKPTQHLLMTASVIAFLPMLILFFTLQRYFIRGVVMSGLKG
jgi:multiple sugar transport system permease protein